MSSMFRVLAERWKAPRNPSGSPGVIGGHDQRLDRSCAPSPPPS